MFTVHNRLKLTILKLGQPFFYGSQSHKSIAVVFLE